MKGTRSAVMVAVLAVTFTWSMLRLFGAQYSAGGFYPEYSSLRADPRGTKLLFDSLSRIAGLQAERNYLPLEYLRANHAVVMLLGLRLEELTPVFLAQIEKAAARGNRVAMALAYRQTSKDADRGPIERAWKIRLLLDEDPKHPHPLSLSELGEWTVRERAGSKILAAERKFGAGRVVLLAESSAFANETLIAGRLEAVTSAIGPCTDVIFDEQHFGIAEFGSVVGLARRLRLAGLAFGLAIVTALALWRNTSVFPPPRPAPTTGHYTGRTSFEGLVTLLQRHVRPQQLATACWEQWLKANRHQISPDRLREAAGIAAAGAQRPLDAVREMQIGLGAKGEL